jgi:hypothetical protein
MAEEPTPQDATLPAPVETRSEVTESKPTSEKVESAVENSASADPIETPNDVAPAPTMDVAADLPVAPAPTEPEPSITKGMNGCSCY